MSKISIIIPVYNGEKYLGKCLDSIANQTLLDIEIIVVDDGSTDSSRALIKRYAENDKRIKYETQINQGPSVARNKGIKMAISKYIAFVDCDDWIEKEMYETMYNIAEKYNLNMVMCKEIHDYDENVSMVEEFKIKDNMILDKTDIKKYILPELLKDTSYNSACTRLFNREFINKINIRMLNKFDYGEDLLFMLEVFDNIESTYFINIPFYHYVHRENTSLTNKNHANFNIILCCIYNIRKKYAVKWGFPLYKVALPFIYYSLMDLLKNTKNKTVLQKRRCVEAYLNSNDIKEAMALIKFYKVDYTFKLNIVFWLIKLRLISFFSFIL